MDYQHLRYFRTHPLLLSQSRERLSCQQMGYQLVHISIKQRLIPCAKHRNGKIGFFLINIRSAIFLHQISHYKILVIL